MAIYSTQSNTLKSNNGALYEVVMLADQYGNPVQGGNSAGNDLYASFKLEEIT